MIVTYIAFIKYIIVSGKNKYCENICRYKTKRSMTFLCEGRSHFYFCRFSIDAVTPYTDSRIDDVEVNRPSLMYPLHQTLWVKSWYVLPYI